MEKTAGLAETQDLTVYAVAGDSSLSPFGGWPSVFYEAANIV